MVSALTGSWAGPGAFLLGLMLALIAAIDSTRLFRPQSRIDAVITFGVCMAAGVAACMLIAGIPGLLRPVTVVALLALWALAALLAVRTWGPKGSDIHWTDGLGKWKQRAWPSALVTLAGLALAWQTLVALLLPPYAYDALTYHLTTVAVWVQRGSLAPSPLSRCCAYYPFTPELLVAFPAVLLHDNSLVGLVQLPFVLLGAAATVGLARIGGLCRSAAAAAGALFAVTPAVLAQAPTNYVDVTFAAFVLSSLYAITRYAETGAARQLLVGGLATGMVLGTKGIGALWALALFALGIVAAVIAVQTGRTRETSAITALAGTTLVAAPLGGWWYVRNLAATGNPLYPFTVRLFGTTLLKGPADVGATLTVPPVAPDGPWPLTVALSWASDLKFWNQGSYDYQQRLGGLGPTWAWLGLPLLILMTLILVRRRSLILLPILAVALVFLLQPYKWWARFTLPIGALGALAIAWAASEAPWRWFRISLKTLALLASTAGVVFSSYAVDPQAKAAQLPAAKVLALIGTPPEERTLGRLFHHEYAFLDQVPENAKVVVDLGADPVRFVSPLFGPRFSRTVIPAGSRPAPKDGWIVTSCGRPLDVTAAMTHRLVWDVRDVRVWGPETRNEGPGRAPPCG